MRKRAQIALLGLAIRARATDFREPECWADTSFVYTQIASDYLEL